MATRTVYDIATGTYIEEEYTPELPPEPQAEPVPEEISRRQFYEGLALKEWITRAEALAAMQTGAIPAALQAIADAMTDEDAKFKVLLMFAGNNSFYRSHPFVLVFAMARQMSETETDDFWRFCHAL